MKNPIKFIWKHLWTRIWMVVTSVMLVLLLVVSLVTTQNEFIAGTLNIVLGGTRPVLAEGIEKIYEGDYSTKADVLEAANDFNIRIAEEGTILLKNDNESLPLSAGAKISVFGKNSVNLVYSGSGSGNGDSSGRKTLYDSLDAAGVEYNAVLKSFYDNDSLSGSGRDAKNPDMGDIVAGLKIGETPVSNYTAAVRNSYSNYSDAALVVISRIGGEGFDLPRTMKKSYTDNTPIDGARSAEDHYLQLDKNETDMINEVCTYFDNVIIVLNTSQPIELGFLDDSTHYAYNSKITAALWIGFPGNTGIMALGEILIGKVTPSGHTTDTYARNFKDDPTWANFGNNNVADGNRYTVDGKGKSYYFVEYEEGLNVGYRYYETRGYEDEEWYKNNVVYPFGYGLSYTTFEWEIENVTPENALLTQNTELKFNVTVKNTGRYSGKDVLQLYYTAPYTSGGIEKSHVVLGDFVKTDLLAPGDSETYTLAIPVSEMKSYDYNDANNNGKVGYELEKGEYQIHISHDAHSAEQTYKYNLNEDIFFATDDATGAIIKNLFDDVSSGIKTTLTRNDWTGTMPTAPTAEEREVTQEFINSLTYSANDSGQPWETMEKPTQGVSADEVITIYDMIGVDYDDELWNEFLNQITVSEMINMIGTGAFQTAAIESVNKPLTIDSDGPSGFTNFMSMTEDAPVYNTCSYCTECVMGATWSEDLLYEFGAMVGNEGLVGNERGNGLTYSGWYAPAVNIHRSPFSGRNWEYYSEDGVLSGRLGAQVCLGAQSKGVYTFVKHFALNDQETCRDAGGLLTWADEQTMREIYLKPFEIIVKQGQTKGIMSSFNRVGTTWAGGDYALLTQLLREEWGFRGAVITDYGLNSYLNVEQMIRAGGDIMLNQNKLPSSGDTSATQIASLRRATKNILYVVANSNAMNNEIIGYQLPVWQVALILIDVGVFVALTIWGVAMIMLARKKDRLAADVQIASRLLDNMEQQEQNQNDEGKSSTE